MSVELHVFLISSDYGRISQVHSLDLLLLRIMAGTEECCARANVIFKPNSVKNIE
jgi:hypothetical protein